MNAATPRGGPKISQSFAFNASSEVLSRSSFNSVHGIFPEHSPYSPISSVEFDLKWVPVERPNVPCIGRPLPFELDGPGYLPLSKPSHSKRLLKKSANVAHEARKLLMFADRFYVGASQIKAMYLNPRSNKQSPVLPNQVADRASDSIFAECRDTFSLAIFEGSDSAISAEKFCKGAVEQARSVSESWRQKRKKLAVGGMPSDKTGLLGESTGLKNVLPPRLRPLKHQSVKSSRPLKDESSQILDELDMQHDSLAHDVHFLRDTLTSSGLQPSLYSDEGAHPSFQTEKCFDSHDSSILQEQTYPPNNDTLQLSLGTFSAVASRDEISKINRSAQGWTPRRTKTPELKPSSSFSEPLKAILKGAYDRRAADAMFCQLYLNEHIKNFEKLKVEQMTVPESMQHNFIVDDSTSSINMCADYDKGVVDVPSLMLSNTETKSCIPLARLATPVKSTLIQTTADKMGRPPAKPNMAREHLKALKETIKVSELASIPRHKRIEWSALTPEGMKQRRKAKLDEVAEDLNMPEGCWEVASWFR
jgi:hypothetical protein